MHNKYMPRSCNMMDASSSNGGDLYIWKNMGYKVLAIEKDKHRFNTLCHKIAESTNIQTVCDDMRNMVKYLS